ncbi:MAG: hypothetical protein M1828_006103 [Chrysothrix sp. TS-e1954]|nr:MAG: hypothetical protein M1828_006103 [Chrysothrix sp. TS-e1954]
MPLLDVFALLHHAIGGATTVCRDLKEYMNEQEKARAKKLEDGLIWYHGLLMPRFERLYLECEGRLALLWRQLEAINAAHLRCLNVSSLNWMRKNMDLTMGIKEAEACNIITKDRMKRLVADGDDKMSVISEIERWCNRFHSLLLGLCHHYEAPRLEAKLVHEFAKRKGLAMPVTAFAIRELMQQDDQAKASSVPTLSKECFLFVGAADTHSGVRTLHTVSEEEESRSKQDVIVRFKPIPLASGIMDPSQELVKQVHLQANLHQVAKLDDSLLRSLKRLLLDRPKDTSSPSTENTYHIFAFEVLPNCFEAHPPFTLTQCLELGRFTLPSLEERFIIAHSLAQKLSEFHSVGWLHKTIHSDNVLFDRKQPPMQAAAGREILPAAPSDEPLYKSHYLYGCEGTFSKHNPSVIETEEKYALYHHSEFYQDEPHVDDELDDIYALGVLLLEIGLWTSAHPKSVVADVQSARNLEALLRARAAARLPFLMGEAYTSAVMACLNRSMIPLPANPNLRRSNETRVRINWAFLEKVVWVLARGPVLKL